MDTQKQSLTVKQTQPVPNAQLWIGQHEQSLYHVQLFLQKKFCPHNGCQICITCMHIRDKQHHAIMWLAPDKTYTIDQLDGLFSTIAYALQPHEHFFFVIQKADLLTNACANKLLKPMEEPPAGYHFILLAEHMENILPTVISRCIVQKIASRTDISSHHPLFLSFTSQPCSSVEFSKMIDTAGLNERESIELCNEILQHWIKKLIKNDTPDKQAKNCQDIIKQLKSAYTQPLMPGSSTLFWRNLYFKLHTLLITFL